jgi:IclR family transcriptional regulator, KDG regulon repressor
MLQIMKNDVNNGNHSAYKSISRAVNILSCLSNGMSTVTEIAQSCGLSKPTVSRLLKAIEKSNLAVRDPVHRKFYLGPLLNHLVANPRTTHLNLITLSSGEMDRLSKICGETIVLGILIGNRNIRLHTIPSIHNVRVYGETDDEPDGLKFQGAATKALLSQLNARELTRLVRNIKSNGGNNNSEFNGKEFNQQLKEIKNQGYAISRAEKVAGALAISVPIKGYQFPAVLSIVGIESRFKPLVSALIPEIVSSANRISSNLPEPY